MNSVCSSGDGSNTPWSAACRAGCLQLLLQPQVFPEVTLGQTDNSHRQHVCDLIVRRCTSLVKKINLISLSRDAARWRASVGDEDGAAEAFAAPHNCSLLCWTMSQLYVRILMQFDEAPMDQGFIYQQETQWKDVTQKTGDLIMRADRWQCNGLDTTTDRTPRRHLIVPILFPCSQDFIFCTRRGDLWRAVRRTRVGFWGVSLVLNTDFHDGSSLLHPLRNISAGTCWFAFCPPVKWVAPFFNLLQWRNEEQNRIKINN